MTIHFRPGGASPFLATALGELENCCVGLRAPPVAVVLYRRVGGVPLGGGIAAAGPAGQGARMAIPRLYAGWFVNIRRKCWVGSLVRPIASWVGVLMLGPPDVLGSHGVIVNVTMWTST